MVHFDKLIVKDDVKYIALILKPGGSAFLHHSNNGDFAPDSDWAKNTGTRSDMSAEIMKEYTHTYGLEVTRQEIHGLQQGWGMNEHDCVSLLGKPCPPRKPIPLVPIQGPGQ